MSLEKELDKEEILELYMNIIYMGQNVYGVKAAALAYFDKDVSDLSLAECAFLAGITNNPAKYNPFTVKGRTNCYKRQINILDKMLECEFITEEEYIEAIQDGTIPPEKQDKYLNIVVQETNRLSKLTSSLLELNNADTYGLWLVFKDFDIVQLVKNAMRTFEGKCEGKNISLILNNHCDKSKVHGDKTKIEQVIYNLLDNAIKFTPEGKSIYITLTEKGEKIFVSVKDEGCGIPKDSVNKVWTRFYKADASRGKDKQGTGLGLSITKEIIKAHNENINVVSTEGVGSEFSFSLSKASKEDTDTTKE